MTSVRSRSRHKKNKHGFDHGKEEGHGGECGADISKSGSRTGDMSAGFSPSANYSSSAGGRPPPIASSAYLSMNRHTFPGASNTNGSGGRGHSDRRRRRSSRGSGEMSREPGISSWMSSSEVCDVSGSGADGGGDQGADGFVELRDGMDATGRGGMSRSTPEGLGTPATATSPWGGIARRSSTASSSGRAFESRGGESRRSSGTPHREGFLSTAVLEERAF